MLNPDLDTKALAAEFEKDGRIRIENILTPGVAERVRAYCLTDVPFETIYYLDGENHVSPVEEMASKSFVWNIQMELFEAVVQEAGDKQVRTLKGDEFLENRVDALTGIQEFLGLGYDGNEIAQIADSPQFQRHSKFESQDYDSSMRKAERVEIEEQYSEEIAITIDWAAKLRDSDVPSRLGHAV